MKLWIIVLYILNINTSHTFKSWDTGLQRQRKPPALPEDMPVPQNFRGNTSTPNPKGHACHQTTAEATY